MPQSAVWILVALAAILVGAAVPALVQLRRTLKVAEETLAATSRKADKVFDELSVTLARVNSAAEEVDRGIRRVSPVFDAIGGIGDSLQQVRSTVGVVATFGATIVTALAGVLGAAFGKRRAEPAPAATEEPAGP